MRYKVTILQRIVALENIRGNPTQSQSSDLLNISSSRSVSKNPVVEKYEFTDRFGNQTQFPLEVVNYSSTESREVVNGEMGSTRYFESEAVGMYIDRYLNNEDFDEQSLYDSPTTEEVDNRISWLSGESNFEKARDAYNDAIDITIDTYSDDIKSGKHEKLVSARKRFNRDFNEGGLNYQGIFEEDWHNNMENYVGRESSDY